MSHIEGSHVTHRAWEMSRHWFKGFKPCVFAKPGGLEFDLVTIKDFFSRDRSCHKIKQCLMSASKKDSNT